MSVQLIVHCECATVSVQLIVHCAVLSLIANTLYVPHSVESQHDYCRFVGVSVCISACAHISMSVLMQKLLTLHD